MSTNEEDVAVLRELTKILDRAEEWAQPDDLAEDENGFSLVNSVREAVREGRVGLALDRYGDFGPHQPKLSELAQRWRKS